MSTVIDEEYIKIPITIFETADTKEDLEDWLFSQNPEFIERMRKARQQDLKGIGKDWEQIKKELCKSDLFTRC